MPQYIIFTMYHFYSQAVPTFWLLHLATNQLSIIAITNHQVVMRPLLNNPPLIQHNNHISLVYSAQPMGDDDLRAGYCPQMFFNLLLGQYIQIAGSFIEQENCWRVSYRPGDSQALPLT